MSHVTPPPPSSHHQQQDQTTCSHQQVTISFFTEVCSTYTTQGGEVVDEQKWDEPQMTDEISIWCPDCELDATYPDWRAAPASIRAMCKKILARYWDSEEEDDGSFTVLIAAEGGQEA